MEALYSIGADISFWTGLQGIGNNSRGSQMALHPTKRPSKENNHHSERVPYRIEENMCLLIWVEIPMVSFNDNLPKIKSYLSRTSIEQ